jgi:hypothetical protein
MFTENAHNTFGVLQVPHRRYTFSRDIYNATLELHVTLRDAHHCASSRAICASLFRSLFSLLLIKN